MLISKDASLRNRIIKIAAPAVLEMIMYMVIGIVDIAVVGRLGAVPLASVSLGAEIFFDILLSVSALGIGSAVLVAMAKGAGNNDSTGEIAGYTYITAVVLGLVIGFIGYRWAEGIVSLFPVEMAVYRLTVKYLHIVFLISPLALVMFMCSSIYRGLGRTDIPMKIAVVTNTLNIVLCFLLVYGAGPIPRLGVAGSALAASSAYVVGFIIMTTLLFSGRGGVKMRWGVARRRSLNQMELIFGLGIPSMTEDTLRMGASLLSSFFITGLGTLAFAAHNVALMVESVSFMPGYGIAIAATALVGHAVGASDVKEAKRAARGSLEMAAVLMGGLGLIFALFPRQIAFVFTSDPDIVDLAGTCIRISSLEQITMAVDMVLGGTLRGMGNTRTPMYLTLVFTWLFRLPLMFVMTRVWLMPITYIWGLFALDWFLRGIIYIVIFKNLNWRAAEEKAKEMA